MSPPPPTTLLFLSSLFSFSIFTAGNLQFIYLRSEFWAPRGSCVYFIYRQYLQPTCMLWASWYLMKFTLKFMSPSYLEVIEGITNDMGTLDIRLVGWWVILDSRQLSSRHPKITPNGACCSQANQGSSVFPRLSVAGRSKKTV